jgi:hypothetical protein
MSYASSKGGKYAIYENYYLLDAVHKGCITSEPQQNKLECFSLFFMTHTRKTYEQTQFVKHHKVQNSGKIPSHLANIGLS